MGRPARTPAGTHLLPTWVPLNIYDFGCWARQTIVPPHHRLREASGTARALPARRAAHRPGPPQPSTAPRTGGELGRPLPTPRQGTARLPQGRPAPAAPGRDEHRSPLDHRAPGERRLLGRHPATRRVLGHRALPPRLRPRTPRDARGPGVAGPLRRVARGRRPDDRGLPVPGVGHLPGHHRAGRRGRAPPTTRSW
ncbi:hypothetical protein LV779_27655 [Streptomyces thinghirensis]|nr:hypothetical protein [Streptomyces thinghirensis]